MGLAFERVGVLLNSLGMSHTVSHSLLLLLLKDRVVIVRSGAVNAHVDTTASVDRAANEVSDLILKEFEFWEEVFLLVGCVRNGCR
jgi:hypothetical protein